MAGVGAALGLLWDAPEPILVESGIGGRLSTDQGVFTTSGIVRTNDSRAYFLSSVQGASDWRTNTADDYARMHLTDFTQTAGTWSEVEQYASGDYWALLEGTTGTLTTTGTGWTSGAAGKLRANPHIHVSAFVYGGHDTAAELLKFTWGDGKWCLHVYGTGTCLLERDFGSGLETVASGQLFAKGSITQGPIRFRLVPLCHRCLYVWGMGQTEVLYEDFDVDPSIEDLTDPGSETPLVASGTLAVQAYCRCAVQVTEVKYVTGGTLTGVVDLPYVPTSTVATTNLSAESLHQYDVYDTSGVSVSASTVDDVLTVTATLSTSAPKTVTPVFYAAGYRYDPTTTTRADSSSNVTAYVLPGMTLNASNEQTTLTIPFKTTDYSALRLNACVGLYAAASEVFRGLSSAPSVNDLHAGQFVEVEVGDEWRRLDKILMPSCFHFDGMLITDAVKHVLMYAGYTSANWDIETSTLRLPTQGTNQDGDTEAAVQPSQGQTVGDFLRYLRDTYTDWFMDFAEVSNVVKFRCGSPESVSTTPVVNFYMTIADAVAAGANGYYTARQWQVRRELPECTQVWVVGTAPGGQEFAVYQVDYAAEAATPPVPAPANYVGEPWQCIIIDPSITTQDVAAKVCRYAFDRWTKTWEVIQFETFWHPNIRRYDWIRLYDAGRATWADYQVTEYSVSFENESGLWHRMQISAERRLA